MLVVGACDGSGVVGIVENPGAQVSSGRQSDRSAVEKGAIVGRSPVRGVANASTGEINS